MKPDQIIRTIGITLVAFNGSSLATKFNLGYEIWLLIIGLLIIAHAEYLPINKRIKILEEKFNDQQ